MKAISLKAPWAWAIFHAGKDIENRSWKSDYRGPLLIHVSKDYTLSEYRACERIAGVLLPPRTQLHLGQVIGVVDLVDYQLDSNSRWAMPKQWHWQLENPRPIKRFYWKGQLGLFDIPGSEIDRDASKNPILEEATRSWRVTVWPHPLEPGKYCFGLGVGGGILGGGIPGHDTYHGCFDTPEQALAAGLDEANA
jgi:hypothetical protein